MDWKSWPGVCKSHPGSFPLLCTLGVSVLIIGSGCLFRHPSKHVGFGGDGVGGLKEAELGASCHWDAQEPWECDVNVPDLGRSLPSRNCPGGLGGNGCSLLLPEGKQEQRGLRLWKLALSCALAPEEAVCLAHYVQSQGFEVQLYRSRFSSLLSAHTQGTFPVVHWAALDGGPGLWLGA